METKHRPYTRDVPGARTALLCVHGILGTPEHFTPLLAAVPGNWTIHNILLKGHGGTPDDFAAATMTQWKAQVHGEVERLSETHEQIVIAAHSMGTLFAIRESLECPKIGRLFLLNVPLRVRVKPKMAVTALKILFERVRPDDAVTLATREAYSIRPDRRLWKYLKWLPNYLALFQEIRRTRSLIPKISVPCTVFQSAKDELVARSAAKFLAGNENIHVEFLPGSGHFYYETSDLKRVQTVFAQILKELG